MPSLIWTERALADLVRLHRFLVEENPDAARRAVRAKLDAQLARDAPRLANAAREADATAVAPSIN